MERAWTLSEPDHKQVATLRDALGVTDLVAQLLVNRKITDADAARQWLEPRLTQLIDPSLMKGMDAAVSTILAALDAEERVTIYGDYDVDGMTASSTLARFLRTCGYDVHVFLPDRFRDGYGINADRIADLVEEGTKLFISVDCGVSSVSQITLAKELGARFVVVDHHQLPEGDLPPADAIINPHQPDCPYPFKDLCAAGLAFHLAVALRVELRRRGWFADRDEPDIRELLDIVAIGTIADVVPLRGINRVLTASGLARIERSSHPGVRALAAIGAPGRRVNASTVAFQIGPRLNAAGRLSHPYKGYEILATDDGNLAEHIAQDIDAENKRRRQVQDEIEAAALEQALSEQGEDANAYVLWAEGWHAGVAGIVAARMVQRFHRPCAVVGVRDGIGKGSIRSITGFNAVAGLRLCADTLDQFGGHPHAAGVTVSLENLPAFRKAFVTAATEMIEPRYYTPVLKLDAEVPFSFIGSRLLDDLSMLGPYGAGNPEPRFCTRGVKVVNAKAIGADGSHLRMRLMSGGRSLNAIAFGRGKDCPEAGQLIDVAYRPDWNEWNGSVSLQLQVLDFKPAEKNAA